MRLEKGVNVNTSYRLGVAALVAVGLPFAAQADVAADVQQQCGSCHALVRDYATQSIQERAARKAPPLDHAGNKFKREWLESWLQKPERIRPAGAYPPAHVQKGVDGDAIDASTLTKHPALSAEKAKAVAGYLMTLAPLGKLIEAQDYTPGSIALRMGKMNFGKFKGCDACHQDAPGAGGVSGPELYTAWHRLQPGFISAYIADPTEWDPHSMMPKGDLNADAVHKLANYLKAIAEKQP